MRLKHMKRKLVRRLPQAIKYALIRSRVNLPELVDLGITFKIATSLEELEQSYKLIYDSYLKAELCEWQQNPIRITQYHLLPTTLVIVAKHQEQVIGTISLVLDGVLGLPIQEVACVDVGQFDKKSLSEITNFAIHPDWRSNHSLFFHLTKFYFMLANDYLNLDYTFIATIPEAADIYCALFGFHSFDNKVHSFDYVAGTQGKIMYLNVKETPQFFRRIFSRKKLSKNLFHFFIQSNLPNFDYPQTTYFQTRLNPEIPGVDRFYIEHAGSELDKLDEEQKRIIHLKFPHLKALAQLPYLEVQKLAGYVRKNTRYETCSPLTLWSKTGKLITKGVATSVSISGIGLSFATNLESINKFEVGYAVLELSRPRKVKLTVRYCWNSPEAGTMGLRVIVNPSWHSYILDLERHASETTNHENAS